MLQSSLAASVRSTLDDLDAADESLAALGEAQLRWSPGDGAWGVGQVLEHLCLTDDSYLPRMRELVARGGPAAGPGTEWKQSIMGGMLVRSFRSTRKLPAPRAWRVGPAVRPDVLGEYRRRRAELRSLLDRAEGFDWTQLRTSSPVSLLVRINLGDCFLILAEHAKRHYAQIGRVRQHPGFPD